MSINAAADATSNINSNAGSDIQVQSEQIAVAPASKKAKILIVPKCAKSEVWKHFMVYEDNQGMAKCNYCHIEIKRSGGTSHLSDHYNICQFKNIAQKKRDGFVKIFDIANQSASAPLTIGPLDKFVKSSLDFPMYCAKWIVLSKQPFETVEDPHFRQMCFNLNPKVEPMTVRKVKELVAERTAFCEAAVTSQLAVEHYAITNDSWTSRRSQSYTAITAHWIDSDFVLRTCALGCQPKEGRAQAADHVSDIETAMERFDLKYSRMVASVTDTDATMIAAGRMLQEHARLSVADDQVALESLVQWHGCVDHILELTTKIAFTDIPESEGTMAICRSLVAYFNQSSIATKILRDVQTTMHVQAVDVIQDVITRW
jgi:hypothetical protein